MFEIKKARSEVKSLVSLSAILQRDFLRWKAPLFVTVCMPLIFVGAILVMDQAFEPGRFFVSADSEAAKLLPDDHETLRIVEPENENTDFALLVDGDQVIVTASPGQDQFAAGLLESEIRAVDPEVKNIEFLGVVPLSPLGYLSLGLAALVVYSTYSVATLLITAIADHKKTGAISCFANFPVRTSTFLLAFALPRFIFVAALSFVLLVFGRLIRFVESVDWLQATISIFLLVLLFTSLGLVGASWFSSPDAAVMINQMIILFLLAISGLLVPDGLLPLVDTIAQYSPLRFGVEMLTGSMNEAEQSSSMLVGILSVLYPSLAMFWIAQHRFKLEAK